VSVDYERRNIYMKYKRLSLGVFGKNKEKIKPYALHAISYSGYYIYNVHTHINSIYMCQSNKLLSRRRVRQFPTTVVWPIYGRAKSPGRLTQLFRLRPAFRLYINIIIRLCALSLSLCLCLSLF